MLTFCPVIALDCKTNFFLHELQTLLDWQVLSFFNHLLPEERKNLWAQTQVLLFRYQPV